MAIDLEKIEDYKELLKHLSHDIIINKCGSVQEPSKITIECVKCRVVVIRCKRAKEMDRKWKRR